MRSNPRNETVPTTFSCDMCHEEIVKGWSEQDALEELHENFPGYTIEECSPVCGDCYAKLLACE